MPTLLKHVKQLQVCLHKWRFTAHFRQFTLQSTDECLISNSLGRFSLRSLQVIAYPLRHVVASIASRRSIDCLSFIGLWLIHLLCLSIKPLIDPFTLLYVLIMEICHATSIYRPDENIDRSDRQSRKLQLHPHIRRSFVSIHCIVSLHCIMNRAPR